MYNRDQPRIPKHHHGGGRWTRDSYGLLSDLGMPRPPKDDDENAQQTLADLPRYAWMRDPQERERPVSDPAWSGRPPVQDPAAGAGAAGGGWSLLDWLRGGISAAEARGWDEYERLSEQNNPDQHAAITFKVGQYRRGLANRLRFDGVERLTRDEILKLCGKFDEAQKLLNKAARLVGDRDNYDSDAAYGRAVHAELTELIRRKPQYGLDAELSFVFEGLKDVPRGTKDSVRPDAKQKEEGEDETLCFLDAKTLNQRLRPAYMRKVANYVLRTRPNAKRVVVIEIRPQK
jgi:hypothetical protein